MTDLEYPDGMDGMDRMNGINGTDEWIVFIDG